MNHTDLVNYLRSVSPAGQARNSTFVSKEALDIADELYADLNDDELEELDEATADVLGDPNRGRSNRAKPKVPRGEDPYDSYAKGRINRIGGKLQKRLASMSDEGRKKYYSHFGMRSRGGGKTKRLYPMYEGSLGQRKGLSEALFGKNKAKKGKVKKVLKGLARDIKGAGKAFGKALATPQSNTDYQITGRKF
jgi:hypothetical protein